MCFVSFVRWSHKSHWSDEARASLGGTRIGPLYARYFLFRCSFFPVRCPVLAQYRLANFTTCDTMGSLPYGCEFWGAPYKGEQWEVGPKFLKEMEKDLIV